jgi:hypothetical protein
MVVLCRHLIDSEGLGYVCMGEPESPGGVPDALCLGCLESLIEQWRDGRGEDDLERLSSICRMHASECLARHVKISVRQEYEVQESARQGCLT